MRNLVLATIFIFITQCVAAQDIREWKNINYVGDTLTGHLMDIYLPAQGEGPFPAVHFLVTIPK